MKPTILGWDVGGANIKAARVHGDAAIAAVAQRPFPLWREPQRLPAVLQEVADNLGGVDAVEGMAVTMTAELADCFATKREGVLFVLDAFGAAFPQSPIHVYGVDGWFRSPAAAREAPHQVAAANWMALAACAAPAFPSAILLDVGSTTTDIIPIVDGRVAALGRTDLERLGAGELVYTGVLRTPVCAIVRSAPFRGRGHRVAAEHFAIAADVHLWLGRIEAADYTCETPDGRGRSRPEAAARLARMVCADLEMLAEADITRIAAYAAYAQERQIAAAIREVRRRLGPSAPSTAVLAGQGVFLARAAAERLGLAIHELADHLGAVAAHAGPAACVARLLAESVDGQGGGARVS